MPHRSGLRPRWHRQYHDPGALAPWGTPCNPGSSAFERTGMPVSWRSGARAGRRDQLQPVASGSGGRGSEQDGAAVYYAAEGLDGGGVVLAGRVQAEPLHRGRGAARVEGAAHQVVEGVGRLDDAAAQRGPRWLREACAAVGRVVGITVGLVLPTYDLGHRTQYLGLLDDVRAEFGDALLVLPGDQHGGP